MAYLGPKSTQMPHFLSVNITSTTGEVDIVLVKLAAARTTGVASAAATEAGNLITAHTINANSIRATCMPIADAAPRIVLG